MAFIPGIFVRNSKFQRIPFVIYCRRYAAAAQTAPAEDAAGKEKDAPQIKKGLLIGAFLEKDSKTNDLSPAAGKFSGSSGGKLQELINECGVLHLGQTYTFQNLDPEFSSVAVVGLGPQKVPFNEEENLDECRENVRIAAGIGARALRKHGIGHILIEGLGNVEAAAEGAALGIWRFQENRSKENQKVQPCLELYDSGDKDSFERGLLKADAQNLVRRLCDMPANLMTPAIFAQAAVDALCPCGVSVEVRDKEWMEQKKMHAFLHVARGSCEPPLFLELGYCGGSSGDNPVVLVGKGVTFDSGGLCLKRECEPMAEFRGDMSGAAIVVAVMRAAARMSLPINIQGVILLCENMPSGMAMRPGDIVPSQSGKSIIYENTDNEGRIVVAEGLEYACSTFKPKLVIDIASLTKGVRSCLGAGASGVFTTKTELYEKFARAGAHTGDRVWRLPLWKLFGKQVTRVKTADITNEVSYKGGGPCRAAAFLREFLSGCQNWIHVDNASCGLMAHGKDIAYLVRGRMTGRPTRTLIQFLQDYSCPDSASSSVTAAADAAKKKPPPK